MVRRINRWVEEGKILRESQAGFRGKRGTRDHIFVLNSLINNRIKKKGGKLYVAFVDFKAAFDKVNRKLMLRKIWEKGIKGKMHRMIRGIYRETNNEVISEEGISEGFKTENGVRQGCQLARHYLTYSLTILTRNGKKEMQGVESWGS